MSQQDSEAAAVLTAALSRARTLHLPGVREQHRQELEQAIELASTELTASQSGDADPGAIASTRMTLLLAHAARARDARHGASQLSQSAQRAPTHHGCDEGWERVENIVANGEASAAEATRQAAQLMDVASNTTVQEAVQAAAFAALDARRIVEERNHAYTFHTDPGFSFGEGWYLAAAAVLAEVSIQLESDKPQTKQALRFLQDAGLASKLVPYRSRPRANKALPDLVARAFRANSGLAQAKLRAAFLGSEGLPQAIIDWADRQLAGASEGKRVLVWIRHATHDSDRNSTYPELRELCQRALAEQLEPVLIGDALRGGKLPVGASDMTLFWKLPLFQGLDMRRAQLQLFEHLKQAHGLVGQVGVTTAGMDGPALMGLPTLYLTQEPNDRLGKWVGAVPCYEEVVRAPGYLERISRTFEGWRQTRPTERAVTQNASP